MFLDSYIVSSYLISRWGVDMRTIEVFITVLYICMIKMNTMFKIMAWGLFRQSSCPNIIMLNFFNWYQSSFGLKSLISDPWPWSMKGELWVAIMVPICLWRKWSQATLKKALAMFLIFVVSSWKWSDCLQVRNQVLQRRPFQAWIGIIPTPSIRSVLNWEIWCSTDDRVWPTRNQSNQLGNQPDKRLYGLRPSIIHGRVFCGYYCGHDLPFSDKIISYPNPACLLSYLLELIIKGVCHKKLVIFNTNFSKTRSFPISQQVRIFLWIYVFGLSLQNFPVYYPTMKKERFSRWSDVYVNYHGGKLLW
jgi:hypothetical protein